MLQFGSKEQVTLLLLTRCSVTMFTRSSGPISVQVNLPLHADWSSALDNKNDVLFIYFYNRLLLPWYMDYFEWKRLAAAGCPSLFNSLQKLHFMKIVIWQVILLLFEVTGTPSGINVRCGRGVSCMTILYIRG